MNGEVRGVRPGEADRLFIELDHVETQSTASRIPVEHDGRFRFDHVSPGTYRLRVLSAPGAAAIYESQVRLNVFTGPVTVELPARVEQKPVAGVVSLRQLQHPPSKKAVQALFDAEQFLKSKDTARAIVKLEQAVKIDPFFHDAHVNLGAAYARQGRYQEAMMQLQAAIDVGPPDVKAYANLAWCYARVRQFEEAGDLARKALELDPNNAPAQSILRIASAAQNGAQVE